LYITPTHLNISFHVHSHHYNLHHFPTRRSSDLYWVTNEKDKVLQLTKKVEQAIQEANIPLTVSPSQEIRMNEEFSEELFAENYRSEEHTSELQSRFELVCRLLLEKKNIMYTISL